MTGTVPGRGWWWADGTEGGGWPLSWAWPLRALPSSSAPASRAWPAGGSSSPTTTSRGPAPFLWRILLYPPPLQSKSPGSGNGVVRRRRTSGTLRTWPPDARRWDREARFARFLPRLLESFLHWEWEHLQIQKCFSICPHSENVGFLKLPSPANFIAPMSSRGRIKVQWHLLPLL